MTQDIERTCTCMQACDCVAFRAARLPSMVAVARMRAVQRCTGPGPGFEGQRQLSGGSGRVVSAPLDAAAGPERDDTASFSIPCSDVTSPFCRGKLFKS